MGNKKSRLSDHIAFSRSDSPIPNIIVSPSTPLSSPVGPPPRATFPSFTPPDEPIPPALPVSPPPPLPSPASTRTNPTLFNAPPIKSITSYKHETMVAGTPPRVETPPIENADPSPPVILSKEKVVINRKPLPRAILPRDLPRDILPRDPPREVLPRDPPRFQTPPPPPNPPPQPPSEYGTDDSISLNYETIPPSRISESPVRRNITYAKDRIAQFEALNTTIRKEKRDSPLSSTRSIDDYPLYNPIEDFNFESGKAFQKGAFPIDQNRVNVAVVGRQGAGKSTLINALRGLNATDTNAAGRHPCDTMEPFRFMEDEFQHLVLWEIPYPRTFASVIDIYDRNMSFNRFYESHKLNVFTHIFVLIGDGSPSDDDVSFSRVVKSRRTPITLLLTKCDDNIDADARESNSQVDQTTVKKFEENARSIFTRCLAAKAQVLSSLTLLLISSPVIRNLVSGTKGFLHYQLDEDRLLEILSIPRGCHLALEDSLRKAVMTMGYASRDDLSKFPKNLQEGLSPSTVHRATVLADAGFEIVYGTDDRVFGQFENKMNVRRAGKTSFNYAFVGGHRVGKSCLINAMRGLSKKHPLAAGTKRTQRPVEKFEFEDEILKYNVTLWEMHYPKKMTNFFEFIDANNISSFTAVFVVVKDGVPSDEDLTFAKIAYRRSASVIFLSSKSDARLASLSRSDEIRVCDLLKQRFIDKSMARFDRRMSLAAPELCGRVHLFFVSSPVFLSLRFPNPSSLAQLYLLHERAVFDFLKQKRIISDILDYPHEMKEGLYANVNLDTAGVFTDH